MIEIIIKKGNEKIGGGVCRGKLRFSAWGSK